MRFIAVSAILFAFCCGTLRAALNVTGFSPTNGSPGTAVVITGTGFSSATQVLFGDGQAIFYVLSSTKIEATVPQSATTGKITVTTSSSSGSSSGNFTVGPQFTDFTPKQGLPGTQVILTGTSLDTVTGVRFNGTAASFTIVAATQITAVVPAAATTGPITISNIVSVASSASNFAVTNSPVITDFTPGIQKWGGVVVVNGANFTNINEIHFAGTNKAASFVQTATTQLQVTVPNGATNGPITIITTNGTASSATNLITGGGPIITSFTPQYGIPGDQIVLSGINFLIATNLSFAGTNAGGTIDADTQITAIVPNNARTGPLRIVGNGYTNTTSINFIAGPDPYITNFPAAASIGDDIVIEGINFVNGGTFIKFGAGSQALGTLTGQNQIHVTVPSGASNGTLRVSTAFGTNFTTDIFIVRNNGAYIDSFAPITGPIGTIVNVEGVNFTGATNISFNGVAAAGNITADTTIQATVPVTTTGPVTIVRNGITNTAPTNFFVWHRIVSLTPTGAVAGTTIKIRGSNFVGASSVRIGGVEAQYTVTANTNIDAIVPSSAITGPVSITTPAGIVGFTNSFHMKPSIVNLTPLAATAGSTVEVDGAGFFGVTNVLLNGVSTTFTVSSVNRILFTIPTTATSGFVEVRTGEGTATSTSTITIVPLITSFTPTNGGSGVSVTITGSGFTGATNVYFNTSRSSFTVNSATSITALVPAGATTGPLRVATAGGLAISTNNFSPTPSLTSIDPTSGVTGTSVGITGENFTGATAVSFNGVSAPGFIVDSATHITVSVPATAITGPVTVTTPKGTGSNAVSFTVLPSIASVSPASAAQGATVNIYGSGLAGTLGVTFNGVTAQFTQLSATNLTAVVPTNTGSGLVVVSTATDFAATTNDFTVLMSVTSFAPTSGHPGVNVTIKGQSFGGLTDVKFNNASAVIVSHSVTNIVATLPPTATSGPIIVTSAAGTASSLTDFTVLPTIYDFSPGGGSAGSQVVIVGVSFNGATDVRFAGISASFTLDNPGQITATVPTNAVTGTIAVQTPLGVTTSTNSFNVLPTLTGFSPVTGPVGTTVQIQGVNIGGATAVQIGGVAAPFTVVNSTNVTATVPTNAVTGAVTVFTPEGSVTSGLQFKVTPRVDGFTPANGLDGTLVTVRGFNFTGATNVTFNGSNALFTVQSDTTLTTTAPVNVTTGPIAVFTPAGSGTSTNSFLAEPTLLILRSGTLDVVLAWQTNSAGFVLEGTTNLVPTIVWTNVTGTPVVVSGTNRLTNTMGTTPGFFRLRKP